MKHTLLFNLLFIVFSPVSIFAAGIYQNQNQSAEFIRTVNRNASTEVDAVYFNPAGTVFLKDGVHLYLSDQYINDQREVRNSSKVIQTYVAVPSEQKYNGTATTFLYPDIYFVYKSKDLAIFGGFGIIGAGASAAFNNGLPMFDTLALGYLAALSGGFENLNYKSNISMEGMQAMLGFSLGGAYKINNILSFALGARLVYFIQTAEIKFHWIEGSGPGINPADVTDMQISMTADGIACSIIASAHVRPLPNMNIGMKFEYHTPLDVKNNTKIMEVPKKLWDMEDVRKGLESYSHGAVSKKTMPMLASIGISYLFFSKLKVEIDFTYFFNKATDWGTDKYNEIISQKFNDGYDVGLAVEYEIINGLKMSVGSTYSVSGRTEKSSNDVDIGLDAITLGFGVTYAFTENLQVKAAAMHVFFRSQTFENDTSKVPDADKKTWLEGKTLLSESTWIAAISATYRFPFKKEAAESKKNDDQNKAKKADEKKVDDKNIEKKI